MGKIIQMKTRRKRIPNKVKLLIFLVIVLSLSLILFVGFSLSKLEVTGSNYYEENELRDLFVEDKLDENTLILYLKLKYGTEKKIPFIQTYDVEYVNLHTLKVQVYDKALTGCIEYMGDYMYFDKDGIVLEISKEKFDKVPLITGVAFHNMTLYEQLGVEEEAIFSTILNLSQLIQQYQLNVKKVSFDNKENVTIYSENIKVLLGKKDKYDEQLAELSYILPKAKGLKGIFDMRNFVQGQDVIFIKQ